ncbi:MAG: PQQ-binding-like beta-propeller repeat protein [Alphaproteobacteria bacterium]|nr:PQQ-binding-like beta-propeller repeat protein [Alphaproteobacteria bacterium]
MGGAALFLSGVSAPSLAQNRHMPLRPATILGRWQTGNRHLVPPGAFPGGMILAGDTTIERWDTQAGQARRVWSQPQGDNPSTFRPRIDGNLVLVSGRGFLSALSQESGQPLWRIKPWGEEFSVPLLADQRIFVGDGHTLRCLDANSGKDIWAAKIVEGIKIHYSPAIKDGVVYLCPGDGVLHAFEADSGKELWSFDNAEAWQYLRQMYFWKDVLVGGGYHDEMWGLSTKNGKVLWRFVAGNFLNSHLVWGNGVYFWSPTGWIYKLSPEYGTVSWRHKTVTYFKENPENWAPLMAELMAANGRIFCLDMKSVLHVLDDASGDETHRLGLPTVRHFIVPEADGQTAWLGTVPGELLLISVG